MALRFVGDRLGVPEVSDLAAVPTGEARVVEHEGQKVAVYREPSGALHAVSAVCTHIGCLVDWNGAERSWDCPCHGSRFAPDGEIIEGPATAPLAALEAKVGA